MGCANTANKGGQLLCLRAGEGRARAGLIGVRGAALLPAALLLIKLQAALSSPFESFDFSLPYSPH